MANKTLKSIKFPGLDGQYKYPELASKFSTTTSYAAGDYCVYEGDLYRFTSAHSGAWNASHAAAVKLVEDLVAANTATAKLHLGFYLDANGDLCQVD